MRRILSVTAVPIPLILSRQQPSEYKGIPTPSVRNPKACHTDRKPELRISCGSI
jgi:hypothetical protein